MRTSVVILVVLASACGNIGPYRPWHSVVILVVLASACGNIGPYRPWHTYAAQSQKPAGPIIAPADRGVLVVLLGDAQGAGNGGYTVFEQTDKARPIAQFTETMVGWSLVVQPPGTHHYYLRTWASDFCQRVDATLTAGKTYVLDINPDVNTQTVLSGHAMPLAVMVESDQPPGGALAYHAFVTFDAAAAQRELDSHSEQVTDCVAHADLAFEKAKGSAHGTGFDTISFEIPRSSETSDQHR